MGKNVRIAIAVAASRGRAVDEQALMIAIRLRMPRCIFTKAESDTTMALSTNIPIAMMIAARDIRCKAIPLANMTIKVAKIEKTNPLPIKRPFLKPIKNNKIATTVTTEMIKFKINPWLATADSYPWSYMEVSAKPLGMVSEND